MPNLVHLQNRPSFSPVSPMHRINDESADLEKSMAHLHSQPNEWANYLYFLSLKIYSIHMVNRCLKMIL